MQSLPIIENPFLRAATLAILVAFCVTVFLGFSMFIDLKPARAQFGFGIVFDTAHAVAFALDKAWDFVKAVAKAFVLKFVANFLVKVIQKLESLHVIGNILNYSDALGLDTYVGSSLNKALGLDNGKEENNLVKIAGEVDPTLGLSPDQIKKLASLSKAEPLMTFTASPSIVKKGDVVNLEWEVKDLVSADKVSKVKICRDDVGFSGRKGYTVDKSTIYVLTALNSKNEVIGTKEVIVKVGSESPTKCPVPIATRLGLTDTQVKKLTRGTLTNLTSQIACGGSNLSLVRNMAIFDAARARGDVTKIDPKSVNYYKDMARAGNPFASEQFQELVMRDAAATIEAQANSAVSQELNSTGLKALRSEQNQVTRSGQTIADTLGGSITSLLNLNSGDGSGDTQFASKIGSLLADRVTDVIFTQKGRVLPENTVCGVGGIIADDVYKGKVSTSTIQEFDAKITANGQIGLLYDPAVDTSVDVEWSVSKLEDAISARVTGLPSSCTSTGFTGKCTYTPTKDATHELYLKQTSGEIVVGLATITILPPPPATTTVQILELSPSFRVRD